MSDNERCILKESGTAVDNNFEGKTIYLEVQLPMCLFWNIISLQMPNHHKRGTWFGKFWDFQSHVLFLKILNKQGYKGGQVPGINSWPIQTVNSNKIFFFCKGASGRQGYKSRQQAVATAANSKTPAIVFCRNWLLRGKRRVCGRVSWKFLMGHTGQTMNFDCWTSVFCLSNESVAK